jgi:hypothetical protein
MPATREYTAVNLIWLEMLRAQRPMKLPDLEGVAAELPMAKRYSALNTAFRLGYVERTGKPRQYEYRVTARCTVPPGVPILEILEATT